MVTEKTDVLIVGAGPTGLMAANQLMRFGINFIIIDYKEGPTDQSRAIAVTARSLEIYDQMGLSARAIESGAKITSFNVFSGGRQKAEVQIGEIGKGMSDFPYLLGFEQSRNEELLYQNLKDHGEDVQWHTHLEEILEHKGPVRVRVRKHGEELEIEAKYLIACDGARSTCRQALHFGFEGGTYENKFFVADTEMEWGLTYDRLIVAPGKENFCGFFPMRGGKTYRVLGTLPRAFKDKEDIEFSDLEKVVKNTLGVPVKFNEVNWFSIYKLHHRCVDKFREGNVFLAGDSAHIHSPAGGQGMNTGLQDAYNIAWKMAFVLKGLANESLLDTYNEERLPFAHWLLKFTDRAFNLMTHDNKVIAWIRENIILNLVNLVFKNPVFRPRVFNTVSQIGFSYGDYSIAKNYARGKLKFKAGDRLPYIIEGSLKRSLYRKMVNTGFHLMHVGNYALTPKRKQQLASWFPFPVFFIESRISDQWTKLGVEKELYILIRPDNYIGALFAKMNRDDVNEFLERYFTVDNALLPETVNIENFDQHPEEE